MSKRAVAAQYLTFAREDLVSSSSGTREHSHQPAAAKPRRQTSLSRGWPGLLMCAASFACASHQLRLGGAYRDRTDDLMLAKQPLSQLS